MVAKSTMWNNFAAWKPNNALLRYFCLAHCKFADFPQRTRNEQEALVLWPAAKWALNSGTNIWAGTAGWCFIVVVTCTRPSNCTAAVSLCKSEAAAASPLPPPSRQSCEINSLRLLCVLWSSRLICTDAISRAELFNFQVVRDLFSSNCSLRWARWKVERWTTFVI